MLPYDSLYSFAILLVMTLAINTDPSREDVRVFISIDGFSKSSNVIPVANYS